jgi:diaminopimelate decarboxylase
VNRLAPRIHPLPAELLASPATVTATADRYGTPLHIVFPQVLAENAAGFRAVLDEARLAHRIFYAHKVNRSRSLVRAAGRAGIGVDIASAGELDQALACGFPPAGIEATGPKGEALLRRLVALEGLVVNVDNLWELGRIAELATRPVPVLLRLSAGRRVSRFGLAPRHFADAYRMISATPSLDLLGLSFHLDTGDLDEKARCVEEALGLTGQALTHGLRPRVLNIGGGFRQAYLGDPDGFDAYVRELRLGLLGRGPALGWGDYAFGYHVEGTGLRGTPVFHRYAGTTRGPDLLRELLDTPLPEGRTLARVIQESLLELWIEPGKALADHAGITVAAVQFTKETTDGRTLVVLDLARDSVTPADQEVMLDPILVSRTPHDGTQGPAEVFLAGRLCLERDMISNHLVRLPCLPRPGDLLIFVNTAAYQMDLSAAEALMHPRAPKVAAFRQDGRFTLRGD